MVPVPKGAPCLPEAREEALGCVSKKVIIKRANAADHNIQNIGLDLIQ